MKYVGILIAITLLACKKPAPAKSASECALETACTKVASDGGIDASPDAVIDASGSGSDAAPD